MNHPAAILFPTMVHGAIIANSAYVTISSQNIALKKTLSPVANFQLMHFLLI